MNREEAINVIKGARKYLTVGNPIWNVKKVDEAFDMAIEALSTDADGEDLIIKGAKGIQDGLYNITDGKLFKYKAKGGTVRTYPIVPSADAEQETVPTVVRVTMSDGSQYYLEHERDAIQADAVQGEWKIDEYGIYHCPFCHAINNTVYKSFCPNCGARMENTK